jgi:CoA:oxalate CoA-transferase
MLRLFEANGLVAALVAQPGEAVHDRQMRENGVIVPLGEGGYTVSSPLWVAGAAKAAAVPAPKLGEHSDAILREQGVTEEEVARLRAQGVVG